MRPCIGLIANPASGKDIRRLVAHGTSLDNQAKVAMIRRILAGIDTMGIGHVLAMPDANDLVRRAVDRMKAGATSIEYVDMPVTNLPVDSRRAAQAMQDAGCSVIVVLGGDGTVRTVAETETPLLAISTGTNNVLPITTEGTLAGMAAAAIAHNLINAESVCYRHKWLEIQKGDTYIDRALVDVAVIRGQFVGARAVWDASSLLQIVATRADPMSIGISAIAGVCCPVAITDPHGIAVTTTSVHDDGNEQSIRAVIAPGVIEQVGILDKRTIQFGEEVAIINERPVIIALDGEREIVLNKPSNATIKLRADGPTIVDLNRAVSEMLANGLFAA